MSLSQYQLDHVRCLQLASELLGEPARPIDFDWEVRRLVERSVRLETRRGIAAEHALVRFGACEKGHSLQMGLERYRCRLGEHTFRLVSVVAPFTDYDSHAFWATPESEYLRLYRALRRELRRELRQPPPIMREEQRRRLWDNTIGFLHHGRELLSRFGVAQKRGVLLLGEPGNGKTTACRWLRYECSRHGFGWRSVSAEAFEEARSSGEAHELFELDRPGVVVFDDVDMAVRDRGQFDQCGMQSTFLGGLDGLETRCGVVYLFTSNARQSSLDPAFLRPGRIDLVMSFPRPDADLRRRLIESWHAEIVCQLELERLIAETEGCSFAEVDEIKKLLVLGYVDQERWDLDAALHGFRESRNASNKGGAIGFQLSAAGADRKQWPAAPAAQTR
ncbi:MAG TPA: ATP-binding protein [Pirellulales bacterium]|nr:ATP-binding protein [Pirellulales bacterium]